MQASGFMYTSRAGIDFTLISSDGLCFCEFAYFTNFQLVVANFPPGNWFWDDFSAFPEEFLLSMENLSTRENLSDF